MESPTTIGKKAEDTALQYLTQKGLTLITRNYRSRWGELDLIMQEGETLIFVEVRSRIHSNFTGAAASIDFRKQQKLAKTALIYLQQFPTPPNARFDVVALDRQSIQSTQHIEWIKNAFEAMI